jgi:hypothetical protein
VEADVKNNSETGYKAEIAGGVVCKIPIKVRIYEPLIKYLVSL